MKNLTVPELVPLQSLINETSLSKLEHFFINTNLSKEERVKLVNILTGAVLPLVKFLEEGSLKNQNQNHFDHLG